MTGRTIFALAAPFLLAACMGAGQGPSPGFTAPRRPARR